MPDNVHQVALIVRNTGRHFSFQIFHGQDFDTYVDDFGDVKTEMFYKDIVGDESVFPELNFDSHAIFYEIGLVV